jgi:hypothetical protein
MLVSLLQQRLLERHSTTVGLAAPHTSIGLDDITT